MFIITIKFIFIDIKVLFIDTLWLGNMENIGMVYYMFTFCFICLTYITKFTLSKKLGIKSSNVNNDELIHKFETCYDYTACLWVFSNYLVYLINNEYCLYYFLFSFLVWEIIFSKLMNTYYKELSGCYRCC